MGVGAIEYDPEWLAIQKDTICSTRGVIVYTFPLAVEGGRSSVCDGGGGGADKSFDEAQ